MLEVQKLENLQLKETIDRMRFDLDEARAAAVSGVDHHRAGTSTSSVPQTLSRNLGDELNRRLIAAERAADNDDGESVVETIVTTQRTRVSWSLHIPLIGQKIGNRVPNSGLGAVAPMIRVAEGIREYADASTATDPILEPVADPSNDEVAGPSLHHDALPPADRPEAEPISTKDVLDRAHPREDGHQGEVEDEYEALVDGLGVRCTVLEEEMRLKKAERVKRAGK